MTSPVQAAVTPQVAKGGDLQSLNPSPPPMTRARTALMSSTTLGIVRLLTKDGLALHKALPSSGVYRDSSTASSRDIAIEFSRAVAYKVIIVIIIFFRPALLSNH